jgi:ABC-2 type transport system ATP-binding protein
MTSININNVSLSYGEIEAVRNASIEIPENCLFGLIGPDGAGKTSLFRMITTLLVPEKGTIDVFGYDSVKEYRKIRLFTGYMPGRFSLYPDLTVAENLGFYATIFGTTVKKHYHLIEPVYDLLKPFETRLARKLSGGMKQKLALCCALIHNPSILVLDEPTTGVDAVSRKEFWDMLQILKKSGMTILVSTPYMDEATRCDRIALMQSGVMMREDTPAAILADFKPHLYEIRVADRFNTLKELRSMKEIRRSYLFGQGIHVAMDTNEFTANNIISRLNEAGISGVEISPVPPDFEDCFIEAVENKHI